MKVLIADDDLVSRVMLQQAVEHLGHECVVVEDGEQAWARFSDFTPDVLVTDLLMPVMDGLELCRKVRASTETDYTYIILATSLSDRADVLSGMEAGADDYLTKPVDPFDLRTRLVAARRVTSLHAELSRSRAELGRLARTDPLTQLRNRLSLADDLSELHDRSRRYGRSYGLAMCDVDNFKSYNDRCGHPAGDELLRAVAATLVSHARASDLIYRYGGEEFLLVLAEQTLASAGVAGERFRIAVEDLGVSHPSGGVVTISVGVAAFNPDDDKSSATVLDEADAAMYEAKAAGRNRVVLAGLPSPA